MRDLRFGDEDTEIVESDSIRPDRRSTRTGSEIVAHRSRESFAAAVAPPKLRCVFCPGYADAPDHVRGCPRTKPISNEVARAGLRFAYGGELDPDLASDAEVRAASRLRGGSGSGHLQ